MVVERAGEDARFGFVWAVHVPKFTVKEGAVGR